MPADRHAHPSTETGHPTGQPVSPLRIAGLVAGPAGAALVLGFTPPAGMPIEAWRMLASLVQQAYGIEVSFSRWMMIGLPVVVVMLPLTWVLLTLLLFPAHTINVGDAGALVRAEIAAMGRMDRGVLTVRGSIVNATDYRTCAGCGPVDPIYRLRVFRAVICPTRPQDVRHVLAVWVA